MLATVGLIFAWGLVANGPSAVQAAPLEASHVAADAKWLIHVDLDAAHQSKVLDNIREHILEHDWAKKGLAKLKDDLNLDPHADLHGLTMYGNSVKPKQHAGVLIVYGKLDKDKIVGSLKSKPDFKETTEGSNTLYSWTEEHGKDHKHPVVASFPKDDMVVVAADASEVKSALAVIGGGAGLPSGSPLLSELPKGTIFQLAVAGVNSADLPDKVPPIVKQFEQIHVAIGENDGNSFDHTKLDMASEETAQQIGKIVEGYRAFGQLMEKSMPNAPRLIDAVKVSTSGKTVSIDWQASTDDVIKAADFIRAQIKEHGAEMKKLRDRLKERAKEKGEKDNN